MTTTAANATLTEIPVINPITNEEIYRINDNITDQEVKDVYARAWAAQKVIGAMSIKERIAEMMKINDYVLENQEEIIDRIIRETGKSRMDALTAEVFEICDVIDYYKKAAPKILADQKVHTPLVLMGKKSRIFWEPMGVILLISPWNFPFYQGIIPGILAFLSGNAAIWKPSEVTPMKGLMEDLIEKTGFMKDAIQVVYGGKMTGARLIEERPSKIHFTGSVRTGKKIMELASKQLIPVDLELGGKDPSIVLEDIDMERTVNGIMWGAFTNAGQSCTSIERLYVPEKIYDPLVDMLVDKTSKLKISTPDRDWSQPDDCDVGAVTAEFQIQIIEDHIKDAVEKGAKVLLGGSREPGSHHFPPTIVAEVTHDMKIGYEETFGPVVAVMKYKTVDEAIRLANDSPYGLSASVWSKDLKKAQDVARQIVTGNVSINSHMLTEGNPALPFGGIKDSGFGRYKGDPGLHTFSNMKSVLIDVQGKTIEPHWYPFTKYKYDLLTIVMKKLFGRAAGLKKVSNFIGFAWTGLTKLDHAGNRDKIK